MLFRYALLYVFGPIGVIVSIMFVVGLVKTAFHSEPVTDIVEEALEEVTRKRRRK